MKKFGAAVASVTIVATAIASCVNPALAGEPRQARASNAERLQRQALQDVPHCARKLGTVSVADGDDTNGWTQFNLAPPAKLIKVFIQRSGCFNLVDRGTGLNAAERERQIGSSLGLQRRSNVGQGQIKAADYVMVAEVQASNRNSSGGGAAAGIFGALGGPVGGLLGGIRSRKVEANTVLSLTNVRTTETIATQEGYAAKNDVSFGVGGGVFGGVAAGAVGGGYEDTDVGRVVTLAFIDAYAKMVTQLGLLEAGSTGTAEASPSKTFTATAPVALRSIPSANGRALRSLPVGSIVYPTGNKQGLWWEVADENDNVGWVLNTKLAPSQ